MSKLIEEIKQYIPISFYENLTTINVKRSKNTIRIIVGKPIKKTDVEHYKKHLGFISYNNPKEIFYKFEYDFKQKKLGNHGIGFKNSTIAICHGFVKYYSIEGFYWKEELLK